MDAEDQQYQHQHSRSSSHHRPPVLLQSDDFYHGDHTRLGHANHPSHSIGFDLAGDTLRDRDYYALAGALAGDVEEPVAHVHSQACQDLCPVQDLYTEASFSRFSKGARTNLYGLVVVKELGDASQSYSSLSTPLASTLAQHPTSQNTQPEVAQGKPIQQTSIFTSDGDMAYRHLPGRYVFVAAGSTVKCFMSLSESYEFTIGPIASSTSDSAPTPIEAELKEKDPRAENEAPTAEESSKNGSTSGSSQTSARATAAPILNYEIISMDAYERKDERGCQLLLVLSIAKGEDPTQFEVRFYGINSFGSSIRDLLLRLPNTTDVQSIPLAWAPTKIIHAPLEDDPFELAVLIAGSDSCVHLFLENPSTTVPRTKIFEERPIESHFPLLASFPHCEYCVLSLVVKDFPSCRVVAAGTQNGTLNVAIIPRNPETLKLNRAQAKTHTIVLFAPITTLVVFTSRVEPERRQSQQRRTKRYHSSANMTLDVNEVNEVKNTLLEQSNRGDVSNRPTSGIDDSWKCGEAKKEDTNEEEEEEEEEDASIHLLVTCAIEQGWIYSDIIKHGLNRRSDLAECSYHDSILAAYVMDADWDGRQEIMIGTYGRQLMVFKELAPGQGPYSNSLSTRSESGHHHTLSRFQQQRRQQYCPTPSLSRFISSSSPPVWGMTWNRRLATPVYGISSVDLNDDGLEELVVTTLNGVSFFLPDPLSAKRRLAQAVNRMREIEELRSTLEQLRRSNEEILEARRGRKEEEEKERLRKIQRPKEEKEEEEKERERVEKEEEAQLRKEEKEFQTIEEKEHQEIEEYLQQEKRSLQMDEALKGGEKKPELNLEATWNEEPRQSIQEENQKN